MTQSTLLEKADSPINPPFKGIPPAVVYRGFTQADHADAFCRGDIRLSTLGKCRDIEESPERIDRHEGRVSYQTNLLTNEGPQAIDSKELRTQAKRLGIEIVGPITGTFTFKNATGRTTEQDGYILCFSEDLEIARGKFGPFVVEVREPRHFVAGVWQFLQAQSGEWRCALGRVYYGTREFDASEKSPAPAPFLKPEAYRVEKEQRMLWWPQDRRPVSPEIMSVEAIRRWCRRVL